MMILLGSSCSRRIRRGVREPCLGSNRSELPEIVQVVGLVQPPAGVLLAEPDHRPGELGGEEQEAQ
jgi:hypothetical protein